MRALRAASRDRSGIAMTELALFMPVLCLLFLAGLETMNLLMAYMRVNNIAIKVADNVARVRISIDESDINEIFIGAKKMGAPMSFAQNGRIIVSSIEPLMDSSSPPRVVNQHLRWQRCTGALPDNSTHGVEGDGATGTSKADGYGLPGGDKIQAAEDTAVILTEVVYNYQPIVSNFWLGSIKIKTAQAITIRQRPDQVVKNASSLSTAQRALCSNPHTA